MPLSSATTLVPRCPFSSPPSRPPLLLPSSILPSFFLPHSPPPPRLCVCARGRVKCMFAHVHAALLDRTCSHITMHVCSCTCSRVCAHVHAAVCLRMYMQACAELTSAVVCLLLLLLLRTSLPLPAPPPPLPRQRVTGDRAIGMPRGLPEHGPGLLLL